MAPAPPAPQCDMEGSAYLDLEDLVLLIKSLIMSHGFDGLTKTQKIENN